jgi:anti-sigma B factor antagonist
MNDELRIALDRQRQDVVVRLAGEVDMANAAELEATLRTAMSADIRRLVIDVRDLSFIDSSGLRVLAVTARTLAGADEPRTMTVRGAHGPVLRILQITGLEEVLGVES